MENKQLVLLGEEIEDQHGSLVEPVAIALQLLERMHVEVGDSVCIFGADFTGLVLLQLAPDARRYGNHCA